jgi:hypothetical protein
LFTIRCELARAVFKRKNNAGLKGVGASHCYLGANNSGKEKPGGWQRLCKETRRRRDE